jgi:predicted aminopeptidase
MGCPNLRTQCFAALALGLLPGCYLTEAAWEQARILSVREPIEEIARRGPMSAPVRAKLGLVLEARGFAARDLELRAGESFTSYSQLDRDTLILVVSAAHADQLRAHTWWFPIVGRVPYKGYFDFAAARREARRLADAGLDVYLRPADAYSTLGWFNDPLLSTTLARDSMELVKTVVHELTHNTFYAAGSAGFNESFASFVGSRGAAAFFERTICRHSLSAWRNDGRTRSCSAGSGAPWLRSSTPPSPAIPMTGPHDWPREILCIGE